MESYSKKKIKKINQLINIFLPFIGLVYVKKKKKESLRGQLGCEGGASLSNGHQHWRSEICCYSSRLENVNELYMPQKLEERTLFLSQRNEKCFFQEIGMLP